MHGRDVIHRRRPRQSRPPACTGGQRGIEGQQVEKHRQAQRGWEVLGATLCRASCQCAPTRAEHGWLGGKHNCPICDRSGIPISWVQSMAGGPAKGCFAFPSSIPATARVRCTGGTEHRAGGTVAVSRDSGLHVDCVAFECPRASAHPSGRPHCSSHCLVVPCGF